MTLENASTALDIRISAYIHSTAEVEMYFRLSDATDARKMQEIVWTPFNSDGEVQTQQSNLKMMIRHLKSINIVQVI